MIETSTNDTRPIWFDAATISKEPQQVNQVTVDVCIIGGGIAGLTAADILKRAGKTVAVIELDRIGRGETGHTSAHVTEVFDLDYRDLISKFGLGGGKLAAQAMRAAIQRIEENVLKRGIDCDLERVSGYQFTEDYDETDELQAEAEAAKKVGVTTEFVNETPLPFKTAGAIRFDHQAQFNPLKYVSGLARGISGDGSYIFEETRMLEIHDGEPCKVTTDHGTIIAEDVIVAANVPSSNRLFMHTKLAAYRTYAIAARVADISKFKNLYWDILDPYHYIRTFELNGIPHLIIGGEDHKTGTDAHTGLHFQKLEDWAHERFDIQAISHRWSGQVIEPVDGLPFIGRNPMSQHVYVATGFSGTGLTGGTIAGMLTSDLILGNDNPWTELFDAARVKPLAGFKNFITENLDFPSHMISDRFAATQDDTTTLRENQGAIVRMNGKKVAAYRDPQGELHLMSPVCPHMGCFVGWNEAERSWDCPCHGSRFAPTGRLLNGPAVTDLASEEIDVNTPMIPERYEKPVESGDGLGGPALSFFHCPCHAT